MTHESPVKTLALRTALGGMTLLLLLMWSTFTLDLFGLPRYPFTLALLAVSLPALLEALGRRSLRTKLMQLALLVVLVAVALHSYLSPQASLLSSAWLQALLKRPFSNRQWLVFGMATIWTLSYAIGGVRLARAPLDYSAVCARFDASLGWLLALLSARFLIDFQPEDVLKEQLSAQLVQPTLLLGVAAVALARNRVGARNGFVAGAGGFGVLLTFLLVIAAMAGAGALIAYPAITAWREGTQAEGLASVGAAVVRTLDQFFSALYALFSQPPAAPPMPSSSQLSETMPTLTRGQGVHAAKANKNMVDLAALVATAVLLPVMLWGLRYWLRENWRGEAADLSGLGRLYRWFRRWWHRILGGLRQLLRARRQPEVVRAYRAFLAWGARSGLPRGTSETPLEYAARVRSALPEVGPELSTLANAINLHMYGAEGCDSEAVRGARRALRRLRRPGLFRKRSQLWLASAKP